MRKVNFKRLISVSDGEKNKAVYEKDFSDFGIFHGWHKFALPNGAVTTFALVEVEDGTMKKVHCENLKFLKKGD